VLKFLLFFQLLFVVNQVHFPWETGIPALAPVNLIMLLTLLAMRNQPDPLPASPPFLKKALFFFFAMLTLAFLWAQVRDAREFFTDLTYLKNAIFFPLFYFVYLRCKMDQKTTRQLIIWIMIIAAVAGLEAIREGFAYGLGKYHPAHRASGPFGIDWHNANRAGVFYAMFMPMFVSLALFLKGQKLWRIGAIGGVVLLAGGALFTYSRQAYFIALLAVAVLLVRRNIIIAVILSVGLVSLAGYLPDSVTQRVEETKQKKKNGAEEADESTASRWEIWAGGMEMLKNNPLGVGACRFKYEIGKYCNHKGMDAHNFYVLTLAEDGPQGEIALLFLFYTLFGLAKFVRKNRPANDPEAEALTVGFTVCTLCTALGGIYGSPTLEGAVMAPYWALCGLLERYIHFTMQAPQQEGAKPEAPREATMSERFPLSAHLGGGREKGNR
jgi:O-Antigen ligase